MPETSSHFEGASAHSFRDYERSIRGYLRYELVHRNLEPFVSGRHLEVADIGGGSGPDAFWLASMGHHVTLAEPASQQRDYAAKRFSLAPKTVQDNVDIVDATTTDLLTKRRRFDLVLSHGVSQYLTDPGAFIHQLGKLTRKGGNISLLEAGFYGKEAALRRSDKNNDALNQLHATGWIPKNNVGKRSRAFYPEELQRMLTEEAKTKVLQWSGVRMVDYPKTEKVENLSDKLLSVTLEAEHREGHIIANRHKGQMLHFIAQKR